jgi:hypothetical protein
MTSIGAQWIHPLWCRFVYGGRVTRSESVVLVASLAVSALILDEGPHIYYQTASPLKGLQTTLMDYAMEYLSAQYTSYSYSEFLSKMQSLSPAEFLTELLILGITFEYLRFSGRKKEISLAQTLLHRMFRAVNFVDKDDHFWQGLDRIQTECARRLVWLFVVCER